MTNNKDDKNAYNYKFDITAVFKSIPVLRIEPPLAGTTTALDHDKIKSFNLEFLRK